MALIASQSEQVGISITTILATSLIWEFKDAKYYRSLLFLIVITGFVLLLTAPGNYVRLESEKIYMPEFSDYSFLRKTLNDFDVFNAHYIDPANLYPKAIAALILLLSTGKRFELKRTALILAIGGILQGSLFSHLFTNNSIEHYSIYFLSSGVGLEYFFSYTLSIASLISITYIMKRTIKDSSAFYFGILLLLLHAGITTLVGLSPTTYESGSRALFAGDIVNLIFICVLFRCVTGWPEEVKSTNFLKVDS